MQIKKILIAALSVGCLFLSSQTALAYDYESYETTDEGDILVDNHHNSPSHVLMYMLVPTDMFLEGQFDYTIYCKNGEFPEGTEGFLTYRNRLENAKSINKEINDGTLLCFNFGLENGTYAFSSNDYGEFLTLKPDYTVPANMYLEEGFNYNHYEDFLKTYDVTLNDSNIKIYTIYGGTDFIESNKDDLSNFAIQNENALDYIPSIDELALEDYESLEELIDAMKELGFPDETIEFAKSAFSGLFEEKQTEDKTAVVEQLPVVEEKTYGAEKANTFTGFSRILQAVVRVIIIVTIIVVVIASIKKKLEVKNVEVEIEEE